MNEQQATDFLNQFETTQQPSVAPPVAQAQPETTPQPTIEPTATPQQTSAEQFLSQYEKPAQPKPWEQYGDVPPPPGTSKISAQTPSPLGFRPRIITEYMARGFADFASLPGYAVDIASWPLFKIGYYPPDLQPLGGSEQIRKGWESLLFVDRSIQPETPAEAYGAKASEFLGANIVPGGTFLKEMAGRGAAIAATAKPGELRKAFQIAGGPRTTVIPKMAEPATATELTMALGAEAASSVAGGVAAQFGGDIGQAYGGAPGKFVGELAGGIMGGMTPLYFKTAGAAIWNGVRAANTITRERETFMSNAAKAKIQTAMGNNPEAQPNLEQAIRLQKEVPGFQPNLAAATGSEGLAQMQARLDMSSIENYNHAMEKIRQSQEAINTYFTEKFPGNTGTLAALKTYRQVKKGMKEEIVDVNRQISELSARYIRQPTKEIGERLKELRQFRKADVKTKVNQLYDELYQYANDLGVVDDMSDLYKLAQNFVTNDATAFQKMPNVYTKMRDVFGRDVDPNVALEDQKIMVPFEKIHSLYREVSRQYGKALKSDDAQTEFYLTQVKELLDHKLSQFDDPIYGTFAERKRLADEFWKNEYHEVFKRGVGGEIPRNTRFNQVTPDEAIVSKLVMQPGTSRGLDQFNKLYEGMPEAQVLLRNGILDMFASQVQKKGSIESADIKGFLNTYREVFDKIPDMRNVFMNSDSITNALVNRRANIVQKDKMFRNKSLSPYAETAGFNTPQAAVSAGFNDPKIMRILTRNVKTRQEKKDLAKTMADVVLEKKDPWKFIIDNEKLLKDNFDQLGPNHFQHIKNIAQAQTIMGRYTPKPTPIKPAEQDAFYKKFGTTFASALSQWRWALFYNKTSAYYPAADMGSKYLNKIKNDRIDQLLERALYDPDLAKTASDLSQIKTFDLRDIKTLNLLGDLGTHAINNGIRNVVVSGSPEEENKPLRQ